MHAASKPHRPIRLATRAIIVEAGRLLLVNAWPGKTSDLLCAPGGGAEPHQSLPDNLRREVYEETGLTVAVGAVCLINEFHDPDRDFHQTDIYFRATVTEGVLRADWQDPEQIVTERFWLTREEMAQRRIKPDSLADVAFGPADAPVFYDPLEPIVR